MSPATASSCGQEPGARDSRPEPALAHAGEEPDAHSTVALRIVTGAEPSPGAPGTLALRRYRDEDARAVRELHDLALMAAGVHLGRGPWDDDLDDIPGTYLGTGGEFLLGSVDGRLVAIGALRHVNETEAEIKRIRVHPRFQRRGFARTVLAQLETYARQHEYRRLRLSTTLLQITAQRLIAREGYHEVGRGEVAGVPMIYYAKRLI